MKNFKKARSYCMRRIILFVAILCVVVPGAFSQERAISGSISDESGVPLPGVSIQIKGTTIGTITDLDGKYSINVNQGEVLMISFLGYLTEEVTVDESTSKLDMALVPDINDIDEVVVVGYGTQRKVSVTGAVSMIKSEELQASPSTSVATALAGRLPGLVITQNSGAAGSQSSEIIIRGSEVPPLILVDGVERDFEDLDSDEIENISILKDASATAVYGLKGGSGVIIITTKRGKEGKAKISVKSEYGILFPGKTVDMLDSYEYALLRNEGEFNDNPENGEFQHYSEEELEKYRTGSDPILYPSHEWFDYMTNKTGSRRKISANISGGHDKMRYFTTIGYVHERDLYRDFDVGYDDRSYFRRYNIRSNIDIDVSRTTILGINIGGQFQNTHKPPVDFKTLTYNMFRTPPNATTLHEGKVISTNDIFKDPSPLSSYYDRGYQNNFTNSVQLTLTLDQKLDFITSGLSLKILGSYDHAYTNNQSSSKQEPMYLVNRNTDTNELEFTRIADDGNKFTPLGNSRGVGTKIRVANIRSVLNYKRSFGNHNLSAVAVFTANSKSLLQEKIGKLNVAPKYVPIRLLELAGRLTYNYKDKYIVEGNGGGSASENFHEEYRWGWFPAVSAGWVASNESFFPKNNVLSFLKFRVSYGITGNDLTRERFYYYDNYTLSYGGGYPFGYDPSGLGSASEDKVGNRKGSWEENTQRNMAIETRWFDSRLKLEADFFHSQMDGGLMQRRNVSTIIAAELPIVNIREFEKFGYELQATWRAKIGEWNYHFRANYNFADNKLLFVDQPNQRYEWQKEAGGNRKQILAMECVGFYTQEDIDFLASNGGVGTPDVPTSGFNTASHGLQAGDLKYKDLNEDGVTNQEDMKYFDNVTVPKTTFGFGGGFEWKNLSFDVFFQGVSDITYNVDQRLRMPFFSGTGSGAAYVMDRWTPERAAAGEEIRYPRMTATTALSDHNGQNSSFWFEDASYIRLKNIEIAYVIKHRRLKEIGISKVRVYANGNNLYTWTPLEIIDPEAKSGNNAPIPPNRVVNLGVNVTF